MVVPLSQINSELHVVQEGTSVVLEFILYEDVEQIQPVLKKFCSELEGQSVHIKEPSELVNLPSRCLSW